MKKLPSYFSKPKTNPLSSLRLRLILLFSLACVCIFAAAAFVAVHETNEKADEFFDTYQMLLARSLSAADWSVAASTRTQEITNKLIKNVKNADDDDEAVGFAVFDKNGNMVFHDNEDGKHFAFIPKPGRFVFQEVEEEKWRLVWLPSADGKYLIAVGQEMDYRRDVSWEMLEGFAAPWLVGFGFLLAAFVFIITVEFMPLSCLASGLRERKADDLSALPEDKLPTEILPLIRAMNALLEKIKGMLERERGFIADSAHEMRSPLTALKVQLEVIQLAQDDEKTKNEALKKLETGIDRASRLVEQLLALSKAESSLQSEIKEKIYWQDIFSQMMKEYREAATSKNIQLDFKTDGSVPFEEGNPVLVSLIARNLIDNAVKYGTKGTCIEITLKEKTLSVFTPAVHVDEKNLAHLGRRFYRPAGQKQTGSGLGLSIIARIAALYRCILSCQNTNEGFLTTVSPVSFNQTSKNE